MPNRKSPVARYGAALLAVAIAAAIRISFTPRIGFQQLPLATFFPAVVFAAWYGRQGPALLAMITGGIVGTYFYSRGVEPDTRVALGTVFFAFLAISGSIALAIEAMHRSRDRAVDESAARNKADLASKESEERFRTMADGLPLLIWVHGAKGEQLFVNNTFVRFFGVQLEEMKGGRWQMLLHPDDAATYTSHFLQCVAQQCEFHAETRVRNGRGEWRWIESWGQPRHSATGEFLGFVGASVDITDRKASEVAIAESQSQLEAARDQAIAATRAKDEFLAALSHELRTPLSPALLLASELEQSASAPESVRKECGIIRANIELEARLIDDLLDVARVSHGKLRLLREPCDLRTVIQRAAEIIRPDFAAKQIRLEFEWAANEPWVQGDPVRLQQVFWNLFRNAAKFSQPSDRVLVRSVDRPGVRRIEVQDYGTGIDPSELKQIFEPFAQSESGSATRAGGLGLGLTISLKIIREHGGNLWAESEGLGRGAKFVVELAAAEKPSASAATQTVPKHPPSALNLLVVEDHEPSRKALLSLLQRRGHEVAVAESIAVALELASTRRFDAVVCDLGLPDGTGFSLMETLHREYGLKGIALSGYGMDADVAAARAAGFAAHLTKPVSIERLTEALRSVLASDDTQKTPSVIES